MVPAGSEFPAVTISEISSKTMLLGQAVSLTLGQDYYYDGKLVAPAGSMVNGTVVQLKKASFAGRNGQLQIKFTSIVSPFGQMIPSSGQIKILIFHSKREICWESLVRMGPENLPY